MLNAMTIKPVFTLFVNCKTKFLNTFLGLFISIILYYHTFMFFFFYAFVASENIYFFIHIYFLQDSLTTVLIFFWLRHIVNYGSTYLLYPSNMQEYNEVNVFTEDCSVSRASDILLINNCLLFPDVWSGRW